jgi:glycerate dehydrogenase
MKIVLLETLRLGADIPFDCLKEFGEVIAYEETNTVKEAVERVEDADIVIVDQFPINEDTIGKAKKLKYVTMTSTGTNFVDFDYTNRAGITVANIKGYSSNSVSQHTFTLLLYLLEKIAYFDDYVKSEKYVNDTNNSSFEVKFNELNGKKWGIVGLGQIGLKVAAIATAFGCDIVYHSPSGNPYSTEYTHLEFDEFLSSCDIISVHTPLTTKTKNMFGYKEFKKMKNSTYFINVSRGAVVDEEGLAKALSEHLIAGAGLDVLVNEPMTPDCPLKPFKDSKKLVITPHMAWASVESRTRSIDEIYLNIKAFINGQKRNICI